MGVQGSRQGLRSGGKYYMDLGIFQIPFKINPVIDDAVSCGFAYNVVVAFLHWWTSVLFECISSYNFYLQKCNWAFSPLNKQRRRNGGSIPSYPWHLVTLSVWLISQATRSHYICRMQQNLLILEAECWFLGLYLSVLILQKETCIFL